MNKDIMEYYNNLTESEKDDFNKSVIEKTLGDMCLYGSCDEDMKEFERKNFEAYINRE